MLFSKKWLRNHPKFLSHFLIHIDALMLCRKFEPIPSSRVLVYAHALNLTSYHFCRRRERHCFFLYIQTMLLHQLTPIRGQCLISFLTHHPHHHIITINHQLKYLHQYHRLISLLSHCLLSVDLLHQSLLYYQNQERKMKQ